MDKDEVQDVYKINFKDVFKKRFDCEPVSKEKCRKTQIKFYEKNINRNVHVIKVPKEKFSIHLPITDRQILILFLEQVKNINLNCF